ncbi:MAG TPA: response regulator transcription factor [Polyangia bacterium]
MNEYPPLRVMIVDDHAVVREGLDAVLGKHDDLQIVASVGNGQEALTRAEEVKPDVVLLDLRMPDMDGLAVLQELQKRHPDIRVVMLSAQGGDEAIYRALSLGAAGYLLKSARGADLAEGVRQAYRGRLKPSAEVAERLAERVYYEALSERELQVLRHAAGGASNKEIAAELGVAENTVKNHVKSILAKLQAKDRTEAVTVALRRGVISLD